MRRNGVLEAPGTLVSIAIIAVILLVTFLGLLPGMERRLEAAEEKGKCEWSVLMASVRKAGTLGLSEGVPAGCKAKIFTVTMAELENQRRFAGNRLADIQDAKRTEYEKIARHFRSVPAGMSDEQMLKEFELNTVIAKELFDCWDKVYKGKLPLFDEWWKLYEPFWAKGGEPTTSQKAVETFIGDFKYAPVNCVLCAHVFFSDDVIREFGQSPFNSRISTLDEWLRINPIPHSTTSYLEFLYDGQTGTYLFKPPYGSSDNPFAIDKQGIAIMYERVNVHTVSGWFGDIGTWLKLSKAAPEDFNYLKLIQYAPDAIQNEGCTFMLR